MSQYIMLTALLCTSPMLTAPVTSAGHYGTVINPGEILLNNTWLGYPLQPSEELPGNLISGVAQEIQKKRGFSIMPCLF